MKKYTAQGKIRNGSDHTSRKIKPQNIVIKTCYTDIHLLIHPKTNFPPFNKLITRPC